jgi:nucleotide-binding universal stress UspA family protein
VDSQPRSALDRVYADYLNNFARKLNYREFQASAVHLHGKPEVEIVDYAEKNDVSLVIMSTRGSHSTRGGVVGGVSEKVLRSLKNPLLFIPQKMPRENDDDHPFKRILLPLDGSEAGEAALPFAKELCRKMDARLYVLHSLLPAHIITGGLEYAVRLQQQLIATLRQQAVEYLNRVAEDLDRENLDIKYDLVSGNASASILDYAKNNNVDLVAISSHGRGMKRFVIGSTADRVIHSSGVPVLCVRVQKR